MLTCFIIDDEPLARQGLEDYVARVPFLAARGSFANALLAADALRQQPADLLLLDIQMPHLTGIDFLKSLKNPPLVIFHTAYPHFALEGFQLDVLDYLVKPVTFERFYKAVSKAQDYHALRHPPAAGQPAADYLFVKCDGRHEKVLFTDLLYVEAMQNYSILYTPRQRYITLLSLKAVEDLLPAARFARVHKSYIVALDKVESFAGNEIKVGGKMIGLGRQAREALFARLTGHRD